MGATAKAVFLSYASQDAEVVRAIAEAMRAGGLEVWFDQAELRGGDAWDQKIRRQIRDCALFVPVISANTQTRGEGYFRREWKLAVERTMDMADGVPYLFPLVLDGVPDRDALVPEVFRHVQWTRIGPAGLPPAFVGNVRTLLEGTPAPTSDAGSQAAPRSVQPGRDRKGGRPRWLFPVVIAGVMVGVAIAFFALRNRGESVAHVPPVAAPAKTVVAAEPAKATPAPALDPRRVALARFENLTGDASLDNVARLLESDLTRGLGTLSSIRLLPIEASSRAAARSAARDAGASSVIVGSYLKQGDQIEISAEIVLVASGEVFGTAGPAATPAANLRGATLADFVDRLSTGAHNVSVTLQNPPTRMSAVTYNRPWPRWSMATRNQAIRALSSNPEDHAKAIEQYRALLAEAPEMLKTKHDLARLLMGLGRYDESQKLFRELLGPDRSRLSESEVLAVTFDEAMLAGDPERAITAARGLLEIRPVSDAITQVISCLWAQNRPRAAFTELDRWWQANQAALPEQARRANQLGLIATEALMHWQEDHPEKTLLVLERVNELALGQPFPPAIWLKGAALATLGREDERRQMVEAAAVLPAASRLDPVTLNWQGYLIALHRGRAEEATRWLAAAQKAWDDMPAARREDTQFLSTGVSLNLAVGRYAEALQGADLLMARYPELATVIGHRALVLTVMGRTEEAAPLVKRLEQWDSRNARGLPQYWRARLAVRTGDKARTVELLRQAVAGGLWFGGFNSPTFDYGRSEPEFAVLRGFAPYEQLLKPKG